MSSDAVARIIKQQVGMWAFAEVGARNFMYDDTSLYFDAKPVRSLVRVVITLDPSDTYTVRVVPKKMGAANDLLHLEGIYADSLADIIRHLAREIERAKTR